MMHKTDISSEFVLRYCFLLKWLYTQDQK